LLGIFYTTEELNGVCAECGQTLQDSSGSFGYPTAEENSVENGPDVCHWRISGTHGEKVVLNITMLDIPETTNCATDYIEIRDGHWIRSPLLGWMDGW